MATNQDQTRTAPPTENQGKPRNAATGSVGNRPLESTAPHELPHDPLSPDPHEENPARASTDYEDEGWMPEAPGSALASEREGVPEGEIPHNLPASAAQPRRKA